MRYFGKRNKPYFWIEKLGSEDKGKRENAERILARIGENSVRWCIEALTDENGKTRESAAKILAQIGKPSVIPLIDEYESISSQTDKALIKSSFREMDKNKDKDVKELIINLIKDGTSDWHRRHGAIVAIGEMSFDRMNEILNIVRTDPQWHVRYEAVRVVGDKQDKKSVQTLVEILVQEENSKVLVAAVESLAKIGDNSTKVISTLIDSLEKPIPLLQREVAEALGELRSPKGVDSLIGLLQNENFEIKKAAITALCKICEPTAIEPLRDLAINSNSPDLRLACVEAFSEKKRNLDLEEPKKKWDAKIESILKDIIIEEKQEYIKNRAIEILSDILGGTR